MYNPHAKQISTYALQSPENVYRVGRFVLATINQHLEHVPSIVHQLDMGDTRALHARGKRALQYLWEVKEDIHAKALTWSQGKEHEALRYLACLPGYGIVKAGFFLQLLQYDSVIGCLDRHNIRAYGLKARVFNVKPIKNTLANISRINQYIDLCRRLGGAQTLWDNWCAYVAALRPKVFPTAESVSALHIKCIIQ